MYCGNHDVVGCSVCFNIYHKACEDIHYVPEYIKNLKSSPQMSSLQIQVIATIQEMEALMKQHKQSRDELEERKAICLQEIQAFRSEINKAVDRLEQVAIKELNDQFEALDQLCEHEMKSIQKTLDDLRKQKLSVDDPDANISQQFVSTKRCHTDVLEAEKLITGSLLVRSNCLRFERYSEILDFLRSLHSLEHNQHQPIKQRLLPMRKKDSLYQLKTKEAFNIKLPEDKNICNIFSLCLLDSGDILMADRNNERLKRLNGNTYIIRDSLKLSTEPNSICKVDAEYAVVCLVNQSLQFVSTENKLVPTLTLNMDHYCLGVCVISSTLFVTDGQNRNIFKYDMNGKLLKKIAGYDIFSWNRFILGSDFGRSVYVSDRDKGLIRMDTGGKVIWTYSGSILKDAWSLCTDGLDNVFVTGNGSSNIVQVTSDAGCIGEVVMSSDCIERPFGVCFDRQKSRLIVSGRLANYIEVYSLK